MLKRRDFILQTAAAGGLIALQSSPTASGIDGAAIGRKHLRILILGATGNIGSHFVHAALARGHQVSLLVRKPENRKRPSWPQPTPAVFPETVERLVGDRNGDLESIKGRSWDAVLDLATYGPGWVRSLGEALNGRVEHYLFISTIEVYERPEACERTRESSLLLVYQDSRDPYTATTQDEDLRRYGALKVLCEQEAERQFPGRTVVLRPTYIVGPLLRWTFLHWMLRMPLGGEVLVPGDSSAPLQWIDVRDLAEFAIRLVEKRIVGVFNAVGPAASATAGEMIQAVQRVTRTSPRLTWVPASWVAAQTDDGAPWDKFWSRYPEEALGTARIMQMSNERALSEGLTIRPLDHTLADCIDWYRRQPGDVQAMFAPGYRGSITEDEPASTTAWWRLFLDRENRLLSNWHQTSRPAPQVEP